MQPSARNLEAAYAALTDTEIAALHFDLASLTDSARTALADEIRRRNMNSEQLLKLHKLEIRNEAKFDRREQEHRERVAATLLRGRPIGKLLAGIVLFAIGLLIKLIWGSR